METMTNAEPIFTSPEDIDCTTAVVLKILDGKCKMDPASQQAVLAVYDTLRHKRGQLFGEDVHTLIRAAREKVKACGDRVHQLRLEAEALISKPTMKAYKARLRLLLQA